MMLSGVGETITQITPLPPIHETVVVDTIPVGSDGVNVYHPINPGSDGAIVYASAPASNPFAGLSTATGLSGTTLMLLAGGAILFFAMKKT